jgi:hemin uptake protein HemP
VAAPAASDPPLPVVQHGKRLCDATEGWCQVCEKMSDVPIVRSEELLRGRREVLIVHGNDVYRLLCTRNNKLILQK